MDDHEMQKLRRSMRIETRLEVESIFALSGLKQNRMWELANGYWPDAPTYDDIRRPWWLVQTEIGLIRIGWRKKVLEIDWESAEFRGLVTEDDVTKGQSMVHAWSTVKAVEYLTRLFELAKAKSNG